MMHHLRLNITVHLHANAEVPFWVLLLTLVLIGLVGMPGNLSL